MQTVSRPRAHRAISRVSLSLIAAASICAAKSALAQVQVSDGQGISFSQEFIDYFDDGTEDVSGTAALNINLSQVNAATGVAGTGYINVVNSDGWVIENLPVF